MTIDLLSFIGVSAERRAKLEAAGFAVHVAIPVAERLPAAQALGGRVRVVLTSGIVGITGEQIAALPCLELISALGAGFEMIDLPAARARGIVVTHGPGTNTIAVADHAWALLMSAGRDVVRSDAQARRGEWAKSGALRADISGKRLGILGLGQIGMAIARRGSAGFDMEVAYHNRRPRNDVPYTYCPSVLALAEWSDFLVVAAPGGAGTTGLIDVAVLRALGPDGFLVNIGRGSVVDTKALIGALERGEIAGAGLDVVDGEPVVPPALVALPNLVLTPHIAGHSANAITAQERLLVENLQAHFGGQPVLTPVREAA
jgi:lactate dehydrogenase-like 2-hydroxyacid dehydrogenase